MLPLGQDSTKVSSSVSASLPLALHDGLVIGELHVCPRTHSGLECWMLDYWNATRAMQNASCMHICNYFEAEDISAEC